MTFENCAIMQNKRNHQENCTMTETHAEPETMKFKRSRYVAQPM